MAIPKMVLVQNIKTAANYIGAFDPCGFENGLLDKDMAEAILERCGACLSGITSALKEGMTESDTVAVTVYGQTEPKAMTLAQLQAWCLEWGTRANERVYRSRIQQALFQANVWVSDLQEPGALSENQATFAAETGERLLQVMRDAQAAGVSERITVELNGEQVTLAEVKDLGKYIASAGSELKEKMNAERAAQDVPYLAALTGDKLKIFNEEWAGLGGMFAVAGSGGEALDTPEKLRDANVWYVWGNDNSLLMNVWRVRGWRFEGDRKTGPYSAQGLGTSPPETAFP